MIALAIALVVLVAAFIAAMFKWSAFNRAVAKACGAPEGRSMSSHIWVREIHGDDWAAVMRPVVDWIANKWTRGAQPNHCELAYRKELAK